MYFGNYLLLISLYSSVCWQENCLAAVNWKLVITMALWLNIIILVYRNKEMTLCSISIQLKSPSASFHPFLLKRLCVDLRTWTGHLFFRSKISRLLAFIVPVSVMITFLSLHYVLSREMKRAWGYPIPEQNESRHSAFHSQDKKWQSEREYSVFFFFFFSLGILSLSLNAVYVLYGRRYS